MSTISANTLFHFTNKLENLEGILQNEFQPKYCLENYSGIFSTHLLNQYNERAIPMVCFCDIPLSQIRNHIKLYGDYAIGLSKKWGIKNRISPVMYCHSNSSSIIALKSSFSLIVEQLLMHESVKRENIYSPVDHRDFIDKLINHLDSIVCYTKHSEGKVFKEGKLVKKVANFYNEREWRFVPNIKSLDKLELPFGIQKHVFTNINEKLRLEAILAEHCKVSFSPNDIKYIIVKNDVEILPMVNKLRLYKHKYSSDDIDKLITKIITKDQILEDF